MAKSLGNFFTIKEILAEHPAQVLRLYLLSTHYRAPIDYAPERLTETARSYERIRKAINTADQMVGNVKSTEIDAAILARFEEAMDDDFNSAAALGVVFDALSDLNRSIASPSPDPTQTAKQTRTVRTLLGYLGIDLPGLEVSVDDFLTDRLIEKAVLWRRLAREAKLYALSDRIRNDLKELGISLEDRVQGTTWQRD